MAAAYATIIFLILLLWTVFGTRIVRRKEAEA
jgi:ABC-type sugar transport system permease subunit